MKKLVLQLAIIGGCIVSILQTKAQSIDVVVDGYDITIGVTTANYTASPSFIQSQPWWQDAPVTVSDVINTIESQDPTAVWLQSLPNEDGVFAEGLSGSNVTGTFLATGESPYFSGPSSTGVNLNQQYLYAISIVPVPEPTTLALAGLGGLSVLMFRRKKS
jgi:hypothetical protein